MSPGAAPPLPSQLKVHFSFCSANVWLIVESFVSFGRVYPCCCIVCDLPTELSRSHHCLTLTSSGWEHSLQKFTNLCYSTLFSLYDNDAQGALYHSPDNTTVVQIYMVGFINDTSRTLMTFFNPPCKTNNTTLHSQTKMHKDGMTFSKYQGEHYNPPNAHTTSSSSSSPILEYHTLAATPMTPTFISNFNKTAPYTIKTTIQL